MYDDSDDYEYGYKIAHIGVTRWIGNQVSRPSKPPTFKRIRNLCGLTDRGWASRSIDYQDGFIDAYDELTANPYGWANLVDTYH